MKFKHTRLHILHQEKNLGKEAKTGVSLHCHTQHSKEMLDFVPHYAEKIPIVSYFWARQNKIYEQDETINPDFSTGYWSPPLTDEEVYKSEQNQINKAGLEAIVSITDHDNIEANLNINKTTANEQAPISMEWTVPFEYGFFHVGVHNLPKENALEISQKLLDYTYTQDNPSNEQLHEVFAMLDALPEVLVVLNHPLWDIEMVGRERHEILLKNFLREHGKWIHAFEINGFRKWSENKAVIELAESMNIPLVTGGDRHGCQPNTVINLTNSKTFAEFAEEVRVDKHSEVALLPEYKQPLHSRQLSSFAEILKDYPEFPEGRRQWYDRVHFDIGDGKGVRPVAEFCFYGGPVWFRYAMRVLGFAGSRKLRPLFRLAMKREDHVPKDLNKVEFEISDPENLSQELTDAVS